MPNLNDSLGPIVCGAFVCTMFFGAITLQLGHYLRNYYREDRVYVRATVLFLYVVHIAFTICICHTTYIMAVTDFGQLFSLLFTPISLNVAQVIGGITNHAVQGFLVFQIYRATRQLYLCIVLWTLDVLIESLALYLCVEFFRTRSIPIIVSNPTFEHWFLVLFIGDAALDWVNASVLCYYLWRQRKRAFSTSTSTLVDQLLVYTLQTGLSTSIVALATAVAFHINPNNYIWVVFFIAMPCSFISAFLANINNRGSLRLLHTSGTRTNISTGSLSGRGHGLGLQIQVSKSIIHSMQDIEGAGSKPTQHLHGPVGQQTVPVKLGHTMELQAMPAELDQMEFNKRQEYIAT